MNAWVAVTDLDWYDFLSRQDNVDEVNFWQPSPWRGEVRVMRRGDLMLFKLKSPRNVIAGGGFFEYYVNLPISVAWDSFGRKNGAASLHQLRESIVGLKRREVAWYEDFTIGCFILVEPFFWPREWWIPQPEDFTPNIVRGKRYDLRHGIGAKLWEQVLERLQASKVLQQQGDAELIAGGYSDPVLGRRRIGQGTFRVALLEAYQRQCAVTREKAVPALEAAHIRPFAEVQTHYVRNGLLLRSDLHRLFDAGYITVTPELRVEASPRMRDDFNDGENYMRLHGSRIWVPNKPEYQPDPELLSWHNENVFRG